MAHEHRVVDGRRRKHYRATELGRTELSGASGKIRELVKEVLSDERTVAMPDHDSDTFVTPADLRARRVGADAVDDHG